MEGCDLDVLPRAYRIGLRLRGLGADDDLIGECLGIDPTGVTSLIEIGRRKLEAVQRSRQIEQAGSDAHASAEDG
jgi:hypothetical protein